MTRPTEMVLSPCGCGMRYPVLCPADAVGKRIRCPWSSQSMQVFRGKPFGAVQWAECDDPRAVYITSSGLCTDRKHRLIVCAITRGSEQFELDHWARLAVEVGESLADGIKPAYSPESIRRHIQAGPALACLEPFAGTSWIMFPNPRIADVVRDQTPNPFLPLAWKPEWFTSTVRDLARHIYDARDFAAMPILADALQDAGCDHQLVL